MEVTPQKFIKLNDKNLVPDLLSLYYYNCYRCGCNEYVEKGDLGGYEKCMNKARNYVINYPEFHYMFEVNYVPEQVGKVNQSDYSGYNFLYAVPVFPPYFYSYSPYVIYPFNEGYGGSVELPITIGSTQNLNVIISNSSTIFSSLSDVSNSYVLSLTISNSDVILIKPEGYYASATAICLNSSYSYTDSVTSVASSNFSGYISFNIPNLANTPMEVPGLPAYYGIIKINNSYFLGWFNEINTFGADNGFNLVLSAQTAYRISYDLSSSSWTSFSFYNGAWTESYSNGQWLDNYSSSQREFTYTFSSSNIWNIGYSNIGIAFNSLTSNFAIQYFVPVGSLSSLVDYLVNNLNSNGGNV